jgi:hypothetical protein
MTINLKVNLEGNDCYFLNDSRNTAEEREKRAGTWYCSIQIRYLNDKCSKKNKCKYYQSLDEEWLKL